MNIIFETFKTKLSMCQKMRTVDSIGAELLAAECGQTSINGLFLITDGLNQCTKRKNIQLFHGEILVANVTTNLDSIRIICFWQGSSYIVALLAGTDIAGYLIVHVVHTVTRAVD